MNTYIFIPDTNKRAGFGHLFRCLNYSNFINKPNKIIFLIQNKFNKKYLINKNSNNLKINYFFFTKLKKTLKKIKMTQKNLITFLDSYKPSLQNFNFKNYSKKHISILDYKIQSKSDYSIDHTFKRSINYHKNNKGRIFIGLKNFPISKRLSFLKRNLILVDFGSVNKKSLIAKSLLFLKNLDISKNYEILVISKYFLKEDFSNISINNKITFSKFIKNIDLVYRKTFFSIGACGISLYEKCFYNIPCISKCLATNQYYNFNNFKANGCILDFDRVTKLNTNNNKRQKEFFKNLFMIKKNIKKNFNYKKNKKHLTSLFNKINEN